MCGVFVLLTYINICYIKNIILLLCVFKSKHFLLIIWLMVILR